GGTGIGQAAALPSARRGATAVVTGRRAGPLTETVGQIEALGGKASAITANVTRSDQVAALLDAVADRHGHLGIAVNNAGMAVPGLVADLDEAAWQEVVATNLTGLWLSMKHEIAHLRLATALPIGRVGTLDEIAAAITWLASPESSFAVGHDLVLDGGATA